MVRKNTGELTIGDFQEQVRMQSQERYSDDPVKLESIDLWVDLIKRFCAQAEDVLFELEVQHDRVGFAGNDPQVARLRKKFACTLGELVWMTFLTASAAGINLDDVLLERLRRDDP